MSKQVVVFIHGIGEQKKGYSRPCQRRIQQQLEEDLRELQIKLVPTVAFREVLWADITSGNQKKLWKLVNKSHDRDWIRLRKFFVSYIGDAIAYQKTQDGSSVYNQIHARIEDEIAAAKNTHQNDEIEFTFVAHSLGSVILSNYLYDASKANPPTLTATNLFTLGSPIAIWLLRHGDPSKANKPVNVVRSHGVWINILDEDDIIAYPLRDINPQYKEAVNMDYMTQIGGLLTQWNPLSHAAYWEDGNVIKPIARKLALDQIRPRKRGAFKKNQYLNYIRNLWNI